jgi:hypothetical protein
MNNKIASVFLSSGLQREIRENISGKGGKYNLKRILINAEYSETDLGSMLFRTLITDCV